MFQELGFWLTQNLCRPNLVERMSKSLDAEKIHLKLEALANFISLVYFYNLGQQEKISDFLMVSKGTERDLQHEMG